MHARLKAKGVEQPAVSGLLQMIQRVVNEFDRICKRRKVKVNDKKSKAVVCKRAREHTIDFAKPYTFVAERKV